MHERQWQKPGRCGPDGGNCVEVDLSMFHHGEIAVRDSKLGEDSPILTFDRAEWEAHLTAVRTGQYDTGGDKVAVLAEAISLLSDVEMLELSAAIKTRTMELLRS